MKVFVLGVIAGWITGCSTGLLWALFYAKGMRIGKRKRNREE